MTTNIRPDNFDSYIGQKNNIENIKIYIDSAKKQNKAVDHILLHGSPGLGKTSLAKIIANEMGCEIKSTSAPSIKKTSDLISLLTNLGENGILFIDEIHRLSITHEEMLYSAMEDFHFDLTIGEGPNSKVVKIELPKFTLIGATTIPGNISTPMKDRFGIDIQMQPYEIFELKQIIKNIGNKHQIIISDECAYEIAIRSRETPRIAKKLTMRIIDFTINKNLSISEVQNTKKAFLSLQIDKIGLNKTDIDYLKKLVYDFNMKPVGIDNISSSIKLEKNYIVEQIEPYLISMNLVERTNKGRVATLIAKKHLGSYNE